MVKHLPTMQETQVRSLGWEDPWRRKQQPTPVLLPGKSHGRRVWQAIVHGGAKSQTRLSDFTSLLSVQFQLYFSFLYYLFVKFVMSLYSFLFPPYIFKLTVCFHKHTQITSGFEGFVSLCKTFLTGYQSFEFSVLVLRFLVFLSLFIVCW